MPRIPRPVFAGVPHHVTQRGNRRECVFFTDDDRAAYLMWLDDYCRRYGVEILAYCLMSNHVHAVLVPSTPDALERALRPLHMRYAQRVNRMKDWQGHVWQGRFFSAALDDAYLWAAIRYVERNPVRAGLVRLAEDYRWSSAATHCGLRPNSLLSPAKSWLEGFPSPAGWSAWLADGDRPVQLDALRKTVERGLPCGGDEFVRRLEAQSGRALQLRPRGGQRRADDPDKRVRPL